MSGGDDSTGNGNGRLQHARLMDGTAIGISKSNQETALKRIGEGSDISNFLLRSYSAPPVGVVKNGVVISDNPIDTTKLNDSIEAQSGEMIDKDGNRDNIDEYK